MTVEVKQRMTEEEAARRFGLTSLVHSAQEEASEAFRVLTNDIEADMKGLSQAARVELAGNSLSNLLALLNAVEKAAERATGSINSENAV